MAAETRPRCTVIGEGALINFRGVNLNEGADPEDMISARLWVEQNKIVGVWLRPLKAVSDILESVNANRAPRTTGGFIATLALRLIDRMEPVVSELNERVDGLEERILDEEIPDLQSELTSIRRRSIIIRRFIFPQRDALTTLHLEELPWLDDRDRGRIAEAVDRITRLAEELNAIRERAVAVQDQIVERRASLLNRNMLLLAIFTVVFLPLQFLTGLLGMNVEGIPGAKHPLAFTIVTVAMAVIAGLTYWLLRRKRFL